MPTSPPSRRIRRSPNTAPGCAICSVFRPHQLSDELEKALHEKYVVGRAAWSRLFDETIARLRYPFRNETLSEPQILDKLSSKDASSSQGGRQVLRQGARRSNIAVFSLVTNTLAKEKEIHDRWRKVSSGRNWPPHLANDVDTKRSRRWHRRGRRLSQAFPPLLPAEGESDGPGHVEDWDRNAPLPDRTPPASGWDEATTIVQDDLSLVRPGLAEIASTFYTKGWIDPGPTGKAPGAFAIPPLRRPTPTSCSTFWQTARCADLGPRARPRRPSGPGRPLGALLAVTPLTLAETASIFGETLIFHQLLAAASKRAQDPSGRQGRGTLITVVRQIAFHRFESRFTARAGRVVAREIGAIWMEVQMREPGSRHQFHRGYEHYWAYIRHFVHAPFYVYAYAFGDGLVNALYATYAGGLPGFQEKYFDMLKAGGSKHHKDLLAPFGLDASEPDVRGQGPDIIAGFIDELEKL